MTGPEVVSEHLGVAIIIPAYNEASYVGNTISSIPNNIDLVILIDDGSTDSTANIAKNSFQNNNRVLLGDSISKPNYLIINQERKGVGAAVSKGLKEILELDYKNILNNSFPSKKEWIVVIMDADGQMDSEDLPELIKPLISNSADHVKGNRVGLKGMPKSRKFGSFLLKILMRFASGYPQINDTQCGYRAIKLEMIRSWNFNGFWNDFGYTNWWLLESGRRSFRLKEVPVKSIYNNKKSKLKVRYFLPTVSLLIFRKLWSRGWDWYVRGKGTESKSLRLIISFLWFSSIISIFSITLLKSHWLINLLFSFISLITIKSLDDKESERRLNSGKYPLIN